MRRDTITDKQVISIIVLFIGGSTLMFDTAQAAKQDIWLAIILAFIGGIIISTIYGRILNLFPNKDLFNICIIIFGKWVGGVLCLLYAFFAIYLASLVINDFAEFMGIIALSETPKVVSMVAFMVLILWMMKEGIVTLGRWCEFFIVIAFVLIFMSFPLFIPHIDINNLRPFLYKGVSPVLDAALSALTFPFLETVLFMGIFSSFKNEKSPYSIYRRGLTIGGVIVFTSAVIHMLVLGPEDMLRLYFPPYTAFRLIDIKGALTRIEIIIATGFLIGGFVKITVCLIVCCKGISEAFSVSSYKIIATSICILTIIMGMSNFHSVMELVEWTQAAWIWWASFFEFILPVIILAGAEIKVRRGKKRVNCIKV